MVSFFPLEPMSTCKIRPTSKGSEAYIDRLAPDEKGKPTSDLQKSRFWSTNYCWILNS